MEMRGRDTMEENFEREVLERLAKIETKIDDYGSFRHKTEEAYQICKNNQKDIEELKDKIKWISRTIAGSIIGGAIGIIFILLQVGIGVK